MCCICLDDGFYVIMSDAINISDNSIFILFDNFFILTNSKVIDKTLVNSLTIILKMEINENFA